MAHVQETVVVPRHIDDVYDFLADGLNLPKWRSGVTAVSLKSGMGVGAVYEVTAIDPKGKPMRGDFRITKLQAPSLITFDVIEGPAKPSGSFQLQETSDDQTTVTYTLTVVPRGFAIFSAGHITRIVTDEARSIANLRAALKV
jgi:uncharacterized membrane protein